MASSGTLLGVSSVLAVIALTLEHGFDLPPWMALYLHAILIAVVAAFVGNRILHLLAAHDRIGHLRNHFIEFSVLALFLLVLPVAGGAFLYLEVYVVLVLGLEAARLNARVMAWSVRPAFVIVGSFAVLILAGTVALLVPRASADPDRPLSIGDAIFTSTSAACVTGLTVRPLGTDFSALGRWIVLALIQVGGLGVVTYTLFFALLQQRSLSVRHSVVIKEVFSLEIIGGVGRLLATVIAATLIFEALGAAAIWLLTPDETGRIEWAVFHSVSAFCNAGFAQWPDHVPLKPGHLIVILALTVLGGLGFPVLQNLWKVARQRRRSEPGSLLRGNAVVPERLTIHSRIVLLATPALLIAGAVFFFLLESHREPLKDQPLPMKLLISLFQSGVARTSGFTAVDVEGTQQSTQVATIALMSVGASPASTGGGIKTVTMALLIATLLSMIRNREDVEIFGKSIPRLFINAAVSILFLYGAAVFTFSLVLAILEPAIPYRKLLFETVSALSTVGLSTGATAETGQLGRLVLCAAMFVGRVGPLAVMMSIASRAPSGNYRYPTEGVIVS